MKGKIIYVDFIKKRRITFTHFIINKLISLLFIKFNIKPNASINKDIVENRHISN